MYRNAVRHDFIARAVAAMPCPVLANGNIYSARQAAAVLRITGARGLMLGRGAVRNPWLFDQIRQHHQGRPPFLPRGRDVLAYVRALWQAACTPGAPEPSQVARLKKHMNYVALGVEPSGQFLHQIRRVATQAEFFRVCEEFLDHDLPMPSEPFPEELGKG